MKKVISTVVISLIFIAFSNAQIENETEKKASTQQVEKVIKKQVQKADSTATDELTSPPVYIEPDQGTDPNTDPEVPAEQKNNKQETPYIDD